MKSPTLSSQAVHSSGVPGSSLAQPQPLNQFWEHCWCPLKSLEHQEAQPGNLSGDSPAQKSSCCRQSQVCVLWHQHRNVFWLMWKIQIKWWKCVLQFWVGCFAMTPNNIENKGLEMNKIKLDPFPKWINTFYWETTSPYTFQLIFIFSDNQEALLTMAMNRKPKLHGLDTGWCCPGPLSCTGHSSNKVDFCFCLGCIQLQW